MDNPRIAWSRSLTPALAAAFVASLIVLIGALVASVVNLQHVYVTNEAVARTDAVRLELQQLLTALVDAETGERGFIITGEVSYLEPYTRGRERTAAGIAQVRALIGDNAAQQADVALLSAAATTKIDELDEAVNQRRTHGFESAQKVVTSNVGKRTMDNIRSIAGRMRAREDALLAERVAQAVRSYRASLATEFITAVVALLAVAGLFALTQKYMRAQVRATASAQAQEAQLREALQLKDEFVALVSHELRTPANTIAGWARMLEEPGIGSDRRDKALAAIGRNAESLRQLLDDLMDTSQLAAGRMRLSVDVVDLATVVSGALDTVRLGADNKGVTISFVGAARQPLTVTGDPVRLKQVVWNLLANAIKFTPGGGTVTVTLAAFANSIRLEVCDTGEGIDPAFLPHVFERFRQAPGSAKHQRSLGLGLAIVRHLVDLHGGTVTAHSDGPGHGSTFVVELPVTAAAQAAAGPKWSEVDRV
jgi:signal transduction histidine kinase